MCKHLFRGSRLSHARLHSAPHDLSTVSPEDTATHDRHAEPYRCELPGNTTIWSLMLYGVTSEEDTWKHKSHSLAPRYYRDKITLFKKALDGIGGRPDFIVQTSM